LIRLRGIEDLDGLVARFEDLVARVLHAVADAVAGLLGATPADVHPEQVSLDDLTVIRGQWAQALDAEVLPALAAAYGQAAAELVDGLAEAGRDVAALATPDAASFVAAARNRLAGVGDGLWEHARDALAEGVRAGESIDELAARVRGAAGVSEARARVIARTEAVAANNAASLAQARMLSDPTVIKEWLATPDGRTRETHRAADGQRVRIGERFEVGEARLDFPGDPASLFPDETVSCRCSIALDLDDDQESLAGASTVEGNLADGLNRGGDLNWDDATELELARTIQAWTMGYNPELTERAGPGIDHDRLMKEIHDAYARPDADTAGALLVRTVAAAPANAPALYRGLDEVDAATLPGEGDTLDLGLSSFSSDRQIAESWVFPLSGADIEQGRVRAQIVVAAGSRALRVDKHAGEFAGQAEWVGTGRYRVSRKTEENVGGSLWTVRLEVEQVG
jgi:SPP1 gp7 family putative phage head morphogenesis protein